MPARLRMVDHMVWVFARPLRFEPFRMQLNAAHSPYRTRVCHHSHTPFRARHGMPCTGPLICTMCNMMFDPATMEVHPDDKWTTYEGKKCSV